VAINHPFSPPWGPTGHGETGINVSLQSFDGHTMTINTLEVGNGGRVTMSPAICVSRKHYSHVSTMSPTLSAKSEKMLATINCAFQHVANIFGILSYQ
jgi:hypothetical protein